MQYHIYAMEFPFDLRCESVTLANIIITRCIKSSKLRKEVGIAIKSKETSSQFESVRNSYVATRCIKNLNLRKEVRIAIKSKETSSQFESVRNSYVAIMHQPVTICSTM